MNDIEAAARAVEEMACYGARVDGPSSRYGFCGHARCGHFHEAADAIRASLPRAAMPPPAPAEPKCGTCGSEDPRVRKCGFDGHATVHDVPVGPYSSGGIRPNVCVSCRDPWHGELLAEGSHPNGPVENCPCHLCRFAFADATPPRHVTPGEERGVDREVVEAAAMAEYVAASLAWWLDDSDEAGNFDGPTWQRFWNAYYALPVEVRRGKS